MLLDTFEGLSFALGVLLSFGGVAFSLVQAAGRQAWAGRVSLLAGGGALFAFLASATLRTVTAGRPPFASMYEFGLLMVIALGLIWLFLEWRLPGGRWGLFLLPGLFLLSSVMLLFFEQARPLMPALKSAWLLSHVMTAVVAYGLLAASFVLAVAWLAMTRAGRRLDAEPRAGLPPPASLHRVMDRLINLAFPFLTLLIITGAVWAQYAWGSFWRWDPKETWALVTWLLYLVYLHGTKLRRWSARSAAWGAAIGFLVVLFTFFGVNLLLAGLHSYA